VAKDVVFAKKIRCLSAATKLLIQGETRKVDARFGYQGMSSGPWMLNPKDYSG